MRAEDNPLNPSFKTGQILDLLYHQNNQLKKTKIQNQGMFGMTQELESFMQKDLDNLNHNEMMVEYYKSKMRHTKDQYLKDLLN